jgi:hypothetical protein
MVPLTAVGTEFAGRVLVAKLGSAGILAELRGISGVYPTVFDRPEVWVEAAEEADARELIRADTDDVLDAAPDALDAPPGGARPRGRRHPRRPRLLSGDHAEHEPHALSG